MSSPVLQSILQGHYVPDFIYRSTDGTVYFTRPSRVSGSTLYGYDQLINLPMYGLGHEVPIGGSTQRIARGVYAGSFGPTAGNVKSDPQPTCRPETICLKRAIASRNLLLDSQRQASAESRRRVPNFSRRNTVQPDSDVARSYLGLPSGDRGHTPGHQERSSPYSVNIGGPSTLETQDRSDVIREPVRAGSYHHSERSRASDSRRETEVTFPLETVTFGLKSTRNDQNSTTREFIDALDERYELDSMVEAGHSLDNVDDTFIRFQINAPNSRPYCNPDVYLTIGEETRKASSASWQIQVPFLGLPQNVLRVYLPLDQASLLCLTNDVLRVLHVQIAEVEITVAGLKFFSAADIAESRRLVLHELERRGFTERLPSVVRLRGLRHRPFQPHPCSDLQPKTVDTSRRASDSVNGKASEKINSRAPVDKDYEADSSNHSGGTTSSGVTLTEDSTSGDSLVYGKGKAHAAKNTSQAGSGWDAKKEQAFIDRGPAIFLEALVFPKSDYQR